MKYKRFFTFLAVCILMQQCAKQTAPTGGAKDEIPPTLIRSNPAHKATNFNGKEIQLTFDELIQLNNPREQLIITPSIGKKFEATAKKNKIVLELNSELKDNTTYTINFRESVQDLTEKNPAQVKLAFSTGPYVDSLNVIGTVKDILTNKDLNNYTVALTPASDTFNIFKHAASWITLADKQGRFALENLKPGKYFIYAFDDRNKNLLVDSKSEKYGFKSDYINLVEASDSIKIQVFKLDASNLKLIASRPTFAYFNIRFSKSLINHKISSSDSTQKIYNVLEPDLSTIKVFNTIPDLDSLQVRVQAQDSTDSKVDTLIYIKFPKKESTKDKFTAKVEFANQYENNSLFSTSIIFSKPVVRLNQDSIYIQIDSLTRITFAQSEYEWNENMTKVTINKKLDEPKKPDPPKDVLTKKGLSGPEEKKSSEPKNQLIIAKGSILSIENDTVSLITTPVKMIKIENYGIISTEIKTKEDFIVQLVDKNDKVVDEKKNTKNATFDNIPAGTYALRLLVDLNKNGRWDAGNYTSKTQPEPVVHYTNPKGGTETFLKANWYVGPLLITY
ncbi:MAG TPA: Ig-like domain-containing protein [Ignavibacteriaceae bacterium]